VSVAPDGSPVDVYLALPSEEDLARIRSIIAADASILDLGSGPGRISNPLAAEGHIVVAVDDSPDMLQHVVGCETVVADVRTLDLHRSFDAVLALSHLINHRSRSHRLQLLDVCRRHLAEGGAIVLQRYPPGWTPAEQVSQVGEIGIRLFDVQTLGDNEFAAAVDYTLGGRSWIQRFESAVVDDAELKSLATDTGLRVERVLDDAAAWVVLRAQN
jgi:SAM-dependent methyltransferase